MDDERVFSEETRREWLSLQELIEGQKKVLLACAQRIIPKVTEDDLLQPNDFKELEFHPYFRYEEGVLAGLLVAAAACRSKR